MVAEGNSAFNHGGEDAKAHTNFNSYAHSSAARASWGDRMVGWLLIGIFTVAVT